MGNKILSISIPRDLEDFLNNNPDLSPSKMFQAKCYDIMKQRKDFERVIKVKDVIIQQMGGFLNEINKWGEFQAWKNK